MLAGTAARRIISRAPFAAIARHAADTAAAPSLADFIFQARGGAEQMVTAPASTPSSSPAGGRSVFIETRGCQMNSTDSDIVASLLHSAGYSAAPTAEAADVVLLNTCAIRENAESKVWQRLGYYKNMKTARKAAAKAAVRAGRVPQTGPMVGVLGCMAERLKHRLLESDRMVDLVAGPDGYRDLPRLIRIVEGSEGPSTAANKRSPADSGYRGKGVTSAVERVHNPAEDPINVQLSLDETYGDVVPLRPAGAKSVFLSIMRGCNNMCSFCVVPFTRGRERSRSVQSIVDEVRMLSDQGTMEVMLLGQNVNSYADFSEAPSRLSASSQDSPDEGAFSAHYARGFRSVYRPRRDGALSFAELLDRVADVNNEMRVRFTSPHPKDFSDDVLAVLAARPNVCKQLHMPAQSGSSRVLNLMRRGYSRETYDALVTHVRATLPGVSLSTDMIAGFCGETEADHAASVDLLRSTQYDIAFLFAYSTRERTHAARHLQDDVPAADKLRRLEELIAVYREGTHAAAAAELGRIHLVLVEGASRRSAEALTGRTDTFKRVVFADEPVPAEYGISQSSHGVPLVRLQPGEYAAVRVTEAGGGTLRAVPLARTTLAEFVARHGSAVPLEINNN